VAFATVVKPRPADFPVRPNLVDYEGERTADFWDRARGELQGLPAGRGFNIAHEALDRHAAGPLADHLAMRWIGREWEVRDFTYSDLSHLTSRFANVLDGLGIEKGDVVCVLSGRIPELYIAALGTLKHRSAFCPLFSAFGPEPIKTRMTISKAKVLVTTRLLYERKVAGIRDELPDLEHLILVGGEDPDPIEGTLDWDRLMIGASEEYEIGPTDPEDMACIHFTSGTTGTPKGAVHVHGAIAVHHITGKLALDLHPDDIYWCTADPGWVTGTSYGIISPLSNGVTMIVDQEEFDAERWYAILDEQHVSVWYTAPTAIRMMMKAGVELVQEREYPALRFMASVGEPLNPECVVWGQDAFGLPFHDNWWQTETGGIMIANFAALEIRPGSMGRPIPGIDAGIVRRLPDGGVEEITEPRVQGVLSLRAGWPSMFRAYLGEPERYAKAFVDGWYLTGDFAMRDADGYYWFIGRGDDVIKTSGHLVGPFEVESVLLEHPAVAEAGVIGKPDAVAGEVVKAFVALRRGYEPTHELERELMALARSRLGAVVAPKEIEFSDSVPKTRSGKIMRRLLKARELGLPEGDISTLEGEE